ncbi:hypothetical protein E2C01_056562 [Portunus trituberculatus]|uniref:Uncharacterized protein n=1 Tax=Portunus trituberculatus TaxID=210409 RepID=A0A5B7GZI8_PORTR|nr:hypothetical protein [Portunus trituberculatus]
MSYVTNRTPKTKGHEVKRDGRARMTMHSWTAQPKRNPNHCTLTWDASICEPEADTNTFEEKVKVQLSTDPNV